MFTTFKVHAELMWEYVDGKASCWSPEMEFKSQEKIKILYSELEKDKEEDYVHAATSELPKEGAVVGFGQEKGAKPIDEVAIRSNKDQGLVNVLVEEVK